MTSTPLTDREREMLEALRSTLDRVDSACGLVAHSPDQRVQAAEEELNEAWDIAYTAIARATASPT